MALNSAERQPSHLCSVVCGSPHPQVPRHGAPGRKLAAQVIPLLITSSALWRNLEEGAGAVETAAATESATILPLSLNFPSPIAAIREHSRVREAKQHGEELRGPDLQVPAVTLAPVDSASISLQGDRDHQRGHKNIPSMGYSEIQRECVCCMIFHSSFFNCE